ncbi:MAG: tetratricopeptide repeat protein [Candidatus Eremiobacterota bacterium]
MTGKKFLITTVLLLTLLVVPVYGQTAEEWKLKGNDFLKVHEYGKALECYQKSLETDPCYARSIHNIGIIYNDMEQYNKALEYFDKALDLVEKGKDTSGLPMDIHYFGRGICWMGLGDYDMSIESFDKAIEANPKNANAWNGKGAILQIQGKTEEALKCYDKALEIDPSFTLASENRERALVQLKLNSQVSSQPGGDDKICYVINGDSPGSEVKIEDYIVSGKTNIIDFYADWCSPCKKLAPYMEKLDKEKDDLVVFKVNIDKWNSPVCKQFNIKSVPSFLVYDGTGKLIYEGEEARTKVMEMVDSIK